MDREAHPLVEYFLIVGISDEALESVCVHGEGKCFTEPLQAQVLSRCPEGNVEGIDLNLSALPMFCFPLGITLKRDDCPSSSHSFGLTKGDGGSVIGFVHTFYERFSSPGERIHGFVPKCLVILTHYPLFTSLPRYLQQLAAYSRSVDSIVKVPVEPFIFQLCYDIPVPQPGGPAVVFGLRQPTLGNCVDLEFQRKKESLQRRLRSLDEDKGNEGEDTGDGERRRKRKEEESEVTEQLVTLEGLLRARETEVKEIGQAERGLFEPIVLRRPSPGDFPWLELPVSLALRRISVKNLVLLFRCLLSERRVIVVSSSLELLAPFAEALKSLLSPLNWQHVFIPVLAKHLVHFLEAPVPYLVGLERSLMEGLILPAEMVLFNIDLDELTIMEEDPPPLPEPEGKQLVDTLTSLFADQKEAGEKELTREIRTAFLDFFLSLLVEYESYLLVHGRSRTSGDQQEAASSLPSVSSEDFDEFEYFDNEGFLTEFDTNSKKDFMTLLLKTQGFCSFIDTKVYHPDEIYFFDEYARQHQGYLSPLVSQPETSKLGNPHVVLPPAEDPHIRNLLDLSEGRLQKFPLFTDESLLTKRSRGKSFLQHNSTTLVKKRQARASRGVAYLQNNDLPAANKEFRKLLLDSFRENVKDLIVAFKVHKKQQSSFGFGKISLREKEARIMKFCHLVEQIFFHGVKKRQNEKVLGQGAFWDFVKSSALPLLAEGVTVIENLSTQQQIRANGGLGRAWLRWALETRHLYEFMEKLLANVPFIRERYEAHAFLLNEDCRFGIQTHVLGLTEANFHNLFTDKYDIGIDGREIVKKDNLFRGLVRKASSLGQEKQNSMPHLSPSRTLDSLSDATTSDQPPSPRTGQTPPQGDKSPKKAVLSNFFRTHKRSQSAVF